MPFDYPNSPTNGQVVTNAGVSYTFDGAKWIATPSGGEFVNVSGDTMTGPLVLSGDPTASAQAANKHYIDNAISLAGNYLGTWAVASNTPSITAGGSVSNANYVAVTVNPGTPETAPGGIPGIAGQTVNNGDRIIWAAGISQWQILRSPSPNVASFNTRTGAVTLSSGDVTTALTYTPYNATNPSGYQTAAQVTAVLPAASSTTPAMDGTAAVGTGTTWARADHVHPTDTSRYAASNPSGYQTAAQVAAVVAGASYADNAGFAINQRGYVSGTALAAGAYGHDRWKAGAGGATYTFAAPAGPSNSITITAGTLQQAVEGVSLAGGTYTLSWTGTAQGRIGAGAYAASPVSGSVTAGANTTIEFNTGTLSRVKFETGSVATPWVALSPSIDLTNCQRFYVTGSTYLTAYQAAGVSFGYFVPFATPMRATPTVAVFGAPAYANASGWSAAGIVSSGFIAQATATVLGAVNFNANFTASADL